MRRPLIVLLALSVSPAERLSAQSPTERAAIETLRDSLARVTDSLSLQRLEAATIQVAKQHRADPLVHVRLGFIAHRLRSEEHTSELQSRPHLVCRLLLEKKKIKLTNRRKLNCRRSPTAVT